MEALSLPIMKSSSVKFNTDDSFDIAKLVPKNINKNEIKNIDTQATALLLGGLGRYFQSKNLIKNLNQTPEQTTNFLTDIIISGIKLENL